MWLITTQFMSLENKYKPSQNRAIKIINPFLKLLVIIFLKGSAFGLFDLVLFALCSAGVNTAGLAFRFNFLEVVGVMDHPVQDLLFNYFIKFVFVHT